MGAGSIGRLDGQWILGLWSSAREGSTDGEDGRIAKRPTDDL